ncbi:MAG: glycosyltransferase family 2 protein [Deltaproteobacteria bacterium]|nr:glycosyltransferase family 2 protein [Deltaproteobacteria bacterium]
MIALNEERDLPRCLESLKFCDEVLVIDSGSADRTVEVARQHGAKVIVEPWRGYGGQKNFAHSRATGDWVLNVDADEVITPELRAEILAEVRSAQSAAGYAVARKTYYLGRWIRHGGWYPNYVTRLVRRQSGSWTEPNVHEELLVTGELRQLANPMLHYTFSDIADQVRTNMRYARQGALDLKTKGAPSSLVKLLLKPLGKFLETYFLKAGFLDGLAGFIISVNAAHSMFLKYAYLLEMSRAEEK